MKYRNVIGFVCVFFLSAAITLVQACTAYQPTTVWMIAPEIALNIDAANINVGDIQTIYLDVVNPNNYIASGNLSIKIGRQTDAGPYEYLAENVIESELVLNIEAGSTMNLSYNWSSAGCMEGTYKVYVKFDYNGTYTTRYKTFGVIAGSNDTIPDDNETDDGGEQGGEEVLEIISVYETVDFGAISMIGVKYESGSESHDKLRVVGYVSGPKKVSNDLNGKTIYKSFCYANTGLELHDIHEDSTFFLNIPLAIKDNCDGAYDLGDYEVTVRACVHEDEAWVYYRDSALKKKRYIRIEENQRCDKDVSYCEECEECADIGDAESFCADMIDCSDVEKSLPMMEKRQIYDVVEFDENVYTGEVFRTKITVFNNLSESESGMIYSYVYDNKVLLSDGFDGGVWSHNWNANKVDFEVSPYSDETVTLVNRVGNLTAGLYTFRARLFFRGEKYDITRRIAVLEDTGVSEDRIVLECNCSGNLGVVNIRNIDSSDVNVSYYILGDGWWDFGSVKVKKKSSKKIDFAVDDSGSEVLVIGGGRDLHKCYVSCSDDDFESGSEDEITGMMLYEEREEKKGFFAWFLGLFGL